MRYQPIFLSTALIVASAGSYSCGSPQATPQSSRPARLTAHSVPPQESGSPLTFGHPASSADTRAITAVTRTFYSAAAKDSGTVLCSLLYSLLEETVAEDFGHEPGPVALRGNSCAVVMTKLYRQDHRRHVAEFAKLRVTSARISYHQALALLSFGESKPSSYIALKRERSIWKINALVANPLS